MHHNLCFIKGATICKTPISFHYNHFKCKTRDSTHDNRYKQNCYSKSAKYVTFKKS